MRKGIALRGALCRRVIKIVWPLGRSVGGGLPFQKNEKFRCPKCLPDDYLRLKV